MAYEYIPDAQRTEEYPVTDELAEMVKDLPTAVSIDNVKYFDPFEQDLIVMAVRELEDVIESTKGSHSAAYYRGVVLSELYGFEDMDEQSQEAACRIALGLYRKKHPENDPKRGNRTITENEIITGALAPGEGSNPMNSHTGTPYLRYLLIDGEIVSVTEGKSFDEIAKDFNAHTESIIDPFNGETFKTDESSWVPSQGFWYPSAQSDAQSAAIVDNTGAPHAVVILDGSEAYKVIEYAEGLADSGYAEHLAELYREAVKHAVEHDENIYAREIDVLRARMGKEFAEDVASSYSADPMGAMNQMMGSMLGGAATPVSAPAIGVPLIKSSLRITATDASGTTYEGKLDRDYPQNTGWETWNAEINDVTNGEGIGYASGDDVEYSYDWANEDLCESATEGYEGSLDMGEYFDIIDDFGYALEEYQEALDAGDPFDFEMDGYVSATLDYSNEYGTTCHLTWTAQNGATACAGVAPRPAPGSTEEEKLDECDETVAGKTSPRPSATVEKLMEWADSSMEPGDYNMFQHLAYIELAKLVDAWNDDNVSDDELVSMNSLLAGVIDTARNGASNPYYSAKKQGEALDKFNQIVGCDDEDDSEDIEQGDVHEDEDSVNTPVDAISARRKLMVIGCENRGICFSTTEEDGKLTFTAQTFGIGEELELFSCDVSALSDDGMNEIPFSEASFEWENLPNMATAFPAWEEDETDFYNEAENAYCHALKEMYGFENLMSCDVYKVCGYENMESIKKDEEYEAIFAMLGAAYGISLDDEQKEKFKRGETFQTRTPFGTVEINSAKVMEEINKNKEANETDKPMLPNDAFRDPSAEEAGDGDDWDGGPVEAYAKVEWTPDDTGGWMPSMYTLVVTEKNYFDRKNCWDDGQTDEYFGIQQMLPSYVCEMMESVYEVDPAVCPKSMSIADVQAKISADCNPDLTLIWNDPAFDALS